MSQNPALAPKPVFVSLSEVEFLYLQKLADEQHLSVANFLRTVAGLPARTNGARTYSERLEIIQQARGLCEPLGKDPDEYLVPVPEAPRPVGRPRVAPREASPHKQAEWEMHRQMNQAMEQLGHAHLPKLPTNWEEEAQYKAEGHGRV